MGPCAHIISHVSGQSTRAEAMGEPVTRPFALNKVTEVDLPNG